MKHEYVIIFLSVKLMNVQALLQQNNADHWNYFGSLSNCRLFLIFKDGEPSLEHSN